MSAPVRYFYRLLEYRNWRGECAGGCSFPVR